MKKLVIPSLKIKIRKLNKKKFLRTVLILLFIGFASVLGALFGAYVAVRSNLPPVSELEHFRSKIITSVYSNSGEVVREFAEQRRIEIPYEKIPDVLKKAIVATEDPRYWVHKGFDFKGFLRAVKEDVIKFSRGRKLEGGSTITQQLARSMFLYQQQTIRRKLKEIFLALKIEKAYSKEKILETYCNHFYLNHGCWGVETASNLYFGKSASELSLEEAAMITGIFRGPSVYSPYTKPEVMLQRRNHVLSRMFEVGYITKEAAEEAKKKPLSVLPLRRGDSDFGAYFFEEVRKYIERNYGSDALYSGGLKVYTTFDPALQKLAEEALLKGLRDMDKKQGWRMDKKNLLDEGVANLEEKWLESWTTPALTSGEIVDGIVLTASRTEAVVRVKNYRGTVGRNNAIAGTKGKAFDELMKAGDVIQVEVKAVDEAKKEIVTVLEQEPVVEGAFLAVDPIAGEIKAMVGGYSYRRSQFNRATQAPRQTGSAIKPFLYTAALENGFTPASIIVDEPVSFIDKWTGEPWIPKNYDRQYKGAVTLRKGLEESRNVVTAKLLDYISPQTGVDYCKSFGITSTIYPYLSLALGTFEVTLLELVSGFTVFPNKGMRVKPYFITRIEDKEGNVLEENKVESEEVISPQTAYMMTNLLQGVVLRGTAEAASALKWPLAGKTGTTDNYTDAWYIGFSPNLCAGVWVGFNTLITLGESQSGAVAALPIWMDFFGKAIAAEKSKAKERGIELLPPEFEVPPNLSFVEIDRKTGLLATPNCLFPLREVFFPGTEPMRYCTNQDHMRILDYYGIEKAKEEH